MKTKYLCPCCEDSMPVTIKEEPEEYAVRGEKISINSKVAYCNNCSNQIWVDELDEENLNTAFDKYRERKKLLSQSKIKEIREKYNVTQVTFSRILGFGDKTIARYETGSIQDEAQNNLILLAETPENFEMLLEKNKDKLSKEDYEKAKEALDSFHPIVIKSNMEYVADANSYYYDFIKYPTYFGGIGGYKNVC